MCLATSDEIGLSALTEKFSGRCGQRRGLAVGGRVDPAVTARNGLPLLLPFGERLVGMGAWAYVDRWIGCGATRTSEGIRPVVVVAERSDPAAEGLPEDGSWVDWVALVTGWDPDRAHTIDWAAVEARLGAALPSDYKRLAELFGHGAFDGFLHFSVPDAPFKSADIVLHTEWLAEWGRARGHSLWEPYGLFPVPGGLLEWAGSEQADQFYWLAEGPTRTSGPSSCRRRSPTNGSDSMAQLPSSSTACYLVSREHARSSVIQVLGGWSAYRTTAACRSRERCRVLGRAGPPQSRGASRWVVNPPREVCPVLQNGRPGLAEA